MSKLPTLFLLSQLSMGGSERKTVRIVNALRNRGEDVHLGYLNGPETLLPEIEPSVPVIHFDRKGKFSWKAIQRLKAYVETHGIARIICINLYPLLYASALRLFMPARAPSVLVTINTTYFLDPKEERSMVIYKPLLLMTDGIIFGCDFQRAVWLKKYRLPKDKCSFIHNGVDAQFYSPANLDPTTRLSLRSKYGLTESDFIIGTVGQMRHDKQQNDLIQAIQHLVARGISVHALLVGEGREKEKIQSLVKSLDIESRVIFLGEQHDVRPALLAMDIFVLPSIETFSNAALEAMAMGKAVILNQIGGGGEMVKDSVNGFLFPNGDVEQLVNLLIPLIQDHSSLMQMGICSRRMIEDKFSFSTMVNHFGALLPLA